MFLFKIDLRPISTLNWVSFVQVKEKGGNTRKMSEMYLKKTKQ